MANTSGDLNTLFIFALLFGLFEDDQPGKAQPSSEPPPDRAASQGQRHPPKE